MDVIINLALIGIILICTWTGYKKGIIMGLGGILVIIVSLYGARLLSTTFSYEVIPAMRPFVSGYMDKQLSEAVYEEFGIDPEVGSEYSVTDMLDGKPSSVQKVMAKSIMSIGIFSDTAETIAGRVEDYVLEHETGYLEALTEVLCSTISYAIGFILAFVLILILLTVAGNLPNFSFRLPGLDMVNDIAGAVLGLVTGVLFCHFAVWVLKFTGIVLSEETVMTGIASWFVHTNLVTRYTGL